MQQPDRKAIVIGVTGGIATGKSTIVGFLVECGARKVSADEIARELLSPGSEMTFRVLAHFGPDFALKGESAAVDRSKLAGLIFSDERARRELGELMHPAIRQIAQIRVDEARSDPSCRLVAEEIPLLYENRLQDTVDYVLVAVCGQDEQVRRLTARQPGATEVGALRQIGSQMPLNDKVRMADFTIDTGQTLDEVRREAGVLYDRLAGISAKRG